MRAFRQDTGWKRWGCGVLLLVVCVLCLSVAPPSPGLPSGADQDTAPLFEERLREYIAWQTEGFLTWLVAKEKQLVQLIRLVSEEGEARAREGQPIEELGFPLVYGPGDSLAAAYAAEIEQLLAIYDDLNNLSKSLTAEDLQLWEEVVRTRDEVASAIDNRKIYAEVGYAPADLGGLIKEFSGELDSLLSVYDRLDLLARHPAAQANPQTQEEIARQKAQIAAALTQVRPPSAVEQRLLEAYLAEVDSLVRVLQTLDTLPVPPGDSAAVVRETVLRTKWELLDRIDQRMVRLAGYKGPLPGTGPTVSEFLAEWEKERSADLEARFTPYLVAKRRLIAQASDAQRDRMLARELKDALAQYAQGDYVLAELQLAAVLDDYGEYYRGLDPVTFYRSECFLAQGFLDAALAGYQEIVEKQPGSEYYTESLLRLMQISGVYGWKADFYRYFEQLAAAADRAHPQELHRAYMLAGESMFRDGRLQAALQTLDKIPASSPHWLEARFLTGVIYAAQNNYNEAVTIFSELADRTTLPWTDQRAVEIRNAALLRLGLIAYQRGDYSRAEEYFARVSSGYAERDKSVIAAAWAAFKQGNYELALATCQRLVAEFPASSYSYEAVVLAAHCSRILGKSDQALAGHRYVVDAQGVVDIAGLYRTELQRLLAQVQALNRLEREALDRRDMATYPEVVRLRQAIQRSLEAVRFRSNLGTRVIADLHEEAQGLLDQIEALGVLIADAQAAGREDLANEADRRRFRLLEILIDLQNRPASLNSSYLVDFPAVAREMEMRYRAQSIATVVRELEVERNRVATSLENIRQLQANGGQAPFSARFELELIERRLRMLQNNLSRFRMWLATQPVQEIGSQLQEWADRAGLEMSDISYSSLQDHEAAIETYADQLAAVDALFAQRRQALDAYLQQLNQQLANLSAQLEAKRVAQEREERALYFKTAYFDTTESEQVLPRKSMRPQQQD
ncbi:MAG: tetratricopeptide repeat protein [Calditrichaeota bacterium]|nr:tetratricopeptide repeat protein [Calditrichota bacterium]